MGMLFKATINWAAIKGTSVNLQKHMSRALQHKHFDHKSGVWFWHMTDQQTLKIILDNRIVEARER